MADEESSSFNDAANNRLLNFLTRCSSVVRSLPPGDQLRTAALKALFVARRRCRRHVAALATAPDVVAEVNVAVREFVADLQLSVFQPRTLRLLASPVDFTSAFVKQVFENTFPSGHWSSSPPILQANKGFDEAKDVQLVLRRLVDVTLDFEPSVAQGVRFHFHFKTSKQLDDEKKETATSANRRDLCCVSVAFHYSELDSSSSAGAVDAAVGPFSSGALQFPAGPFPTHAYVEPAFVSVTADAIATSEILDQFKNAAGASGKSVAARWAHFAAQDFVGASDENDDLKPADFSAFELLFLVAPFVLKVPPTPSTTASTSSAPVPPAVDIFKRWVVKVHRALLAIALTPVRCYLGLSRQFAIDDDEDEDDGGDEEAEEGDEEQDDDDDDLHDEDDDDDDDEDEDLTQLAKKKQSGGADAKQSSKKKDAVAPKPPPKDCKQQ